MSYASASPNRPFALAAAAEWRRRRWRQQLGRPGPRRCAAVPEESQAQASSSTGTGDLLRRAQQLRDAQQRLEAEARAAAAALEPAERSAFLEALGLEGASRGADLPQPQQQQQQQQQQQRRAEAQQQPYQAGSAAGEAAVPGSAEWRATLPPEVQRAMQQSGLAAALDEQAEALRLDQEWAAAEEYGGGDMEAVARILEEGGQLPPMPAEEWEGEAEAPNVFLARLQGSIDYTNTSLKGTKHPAKAQLRQRRPPAALGGEAQPGEQEALQPEEQLPPLAQPEAEAEVDVEVEQRAAAEAAAAQHTSDAAAIRGAARYSLEPALAAAYARGWELGKAADRLLDSELSKAPPLYEQVSKSVPAPALPAEAERVYLGAERIAYVLRRAHVDSKAPDAPLLALMQKGLVSKGLVLQDPFVTRGGIPAALDYMSRLRLAGATLDVSTIMVRCKEYRPLPQFQIIIDCFLDFPYPDWFYSWVVLNHTASSASARLAASATSPPAGPYAGLSAAAIEGTAAVGQAQREQQAEQEAALVKSMLAAAEQAAAAAGHALDDAGRLSVMRAAARICLNRRAEAEQAEQRALQEALVDSAGAIKRAVGRPPEEVAASVAAARAGGLVPPRLLEVRQEPYGFEGQPREHSWVLMDWQEPHLQLGRQQFAAYPRHTGGAGAGEGMGGRREQQQEVEQVERYGSIEVYREERDRRYRQLAAGGILQEQWGREEWLAAHAPAQPRQQDVQQQAAAGEQQQQGSPQQAQQPAAPGGSKARRKKRKGGAADQQARQAAGAADEEEEEQQGEEAEDEELFPFSSDWETQRKRREAGQVLRALLGRNFGKAMGQLPQRGRTRGRSSNAALALQAEAEGTAWLSGECMTVQATFTYTVDASSCQVDTCGVAWGAVHGVDLHEVTDAWDLWLEATGLLHEAECDQDEAEVAAVAEALGGEGQALEAEEQWRLGTADGLVGRACSWVPRWRL